MGDMRPSGKPKQVIAVMTLYAADPSRGRTFFVVLSGTCGGTMFLSVGTRDSNVGSG